MKHFSTRTKHGVTTLVIAAATMLTAGSCVSDNDDNYFNQPQSTNLVTYTGNETIVTDNPDNPGYVSTFTYYGVDNVVATSRTTYETRLPKDAAKPGQRMMISYTLNNSNATPYPSGVINLKSYRLIPTAQVENAPHEKAIANNAEMPIYYIGNQPEISRTGNYINLQTRLRNYTEREFTILADESTLSSDMPDLYISTTPKGTDTGIISVEMASFDITEVWRNPAINGVRIHINNTANDKQNIFEFKK